MWAGQNIKHVMWQAAEGQMCVYLFNWEILLTLDVAYFGSDQIYVHIFLACGD